MKTIHRHDSQILGRNSLTFFVLILICAFALFYMPVRNDITQMIYSFAPRIWNIGGTGANIWNSFLVNFKSKEALVAENDSLHEDLSRMQAQVLDRNLLEDKINNLESSLGRAQSDNRVAADVLAGPGISPYDTLVIDAGSDNGIEVGDLVVYVGSGIIGEIVEVLPASSKVKLYSSPGEEELITIGANNIPAKAIGKGLGNFEARVPQGSAIAVGDNVIMTKGKLILGTVSSIQEEPSLPFISVLFRSPFNISQINSVEIIVSKHS